MSSAGAIDVTSSANPSASRTCGLIGTVFDDRE